MTGISFFYTPWYTPNFAEARLGRKTSAHCTGLERQQSWVELMYCLSIFLEGRKKPQEDVLASEPVWMWKQNIWQCSGFIASLSMGVQRETPTHVKNWSSPMQPSVIHPLKSVSLNSVYDLRLQVLWLINNEMLLERFEALKMILMSTGKFTDFVGDCNTSIFR